MNIFFNIGEWWERRRKVTKMELENFVLSHNAQMGIVSANLAALELSLKESSKVPTGTANELKAIRIRLDQMELYVGLKREKKPETVPGAARIA